MSSFICRSILLIYSRRSYQASIYILISCSLAWRWSSPHLQSAGWAGYGRCSCNGSARGCLSSNTPPYGGGTFLTERKWLLGLQQITKGTSEKHLQNCTALEIFDLITCKRDNGRNRWKFQRCVIVGVEAVVQPYDAIARALRHAVIAGYHHIDATPEADPFQLRHQQAHIVVDLRGRMNHSTDNDVTAEQNPHSTLWLANSQLSARRQFSLPKQTENWNICVFMLTWWKKKKLNVRAMLLVLFTLEPCLCLAF